MLLYTLNENATEVIKSTKNGFDPFFEVRNQIK